MAYATITFKNERTGFIRNAPIGFSWTTFFFGPFPALMRGDWKWMLIILVPALFTMGFSSIIFAFFYNTQYIKDLICNGYTIDKIGEVDKQLIFERNPELLPKDIREQMEADKKAKIDAEEIVRAERAAAKKQNEEEASKMKNMTLQNMKEKGLFEVRDAFIHSKEE